MKKNRTNRPSPNTLSPLERSASSRKLTLPEVVLGARFALRELFVTAGRQVLAALLEEDRTELCGPKHQPQADRRAFRHGTHEGVVVLGGRKVRLARPRVRSVAGQELELPTWQAIREEDPLRDHALNQILVGVSTRGYARSLEPLDEDLDSVSVGRSSVSRRFVTKTKQQVDEFVSRPLGDLDLPVIMIDGTGFGDHVLVVALGIDDTGKKHVLGLVEGSTESEGVCRSLLQSLIGRGLVVERARLFVIDGGKGIRKAIRSVFGAWALVQRCQVHKMRNIVDHLPEGKRAWVRAVVRRAWGSDSAVVATKKLKDLASQLQDEHPGAAASVLEGLEETVTILDLRPSAALKRTLCSTNPIENLQGTLKRVTRNVKRWRGGAMAHRWAGTALIEGEKKFRRIKGHREMPQLLKALEARGPAAGLDKQEKVA